MKKIFTAFGAVFLVLLVWLAVYRWFWPKPVPELEVPVSVVPVANLPRFDDDLRGEALLEAVQRQIDRMRNQDPAQELSLGQSRIPRQRILKTLEVFADLIRNQGPEALPGEIAKYFRVYQASGSDRRGKVLFTGYYQPVLSAQKQADRCFQYPIYRRPSDLQVLDLGQIDPRYRGERIGLRVENGKIRPYFDREAIDEQGVLRGKGLELFYLRDALDRYMLQVQGSGVLKLASGAETKIRFAGSNGYPYVSLGKILVAEGKIPADQISLPAIRQYFQTHPEEMASYLARNRRYIFFEEFVGDVAGSEGVALTPGRSIATDKTLFPGGGLAFVVCPRFVQKPTDRNQPDKLLSRFMVDQDTGAAIKGPGRVDIFWGTGDEAGKIAGNFKYDGRLYFLLIKEEYAR